MPPEAQRWSAETETRLAAAGARARAVRGAGGGLSTRAARELGRRLGAAAPLQVERRRWQRVAVAAAEPAADAPAPVAPVPTRLAPVAKRQARWWGGPFSRLRGLAWLLILVLALGLVGYWISLPPRPAGSPATVAAAASATLTRVGVIAPLEAGDGLQAGDTITVGAGGLAVMTLGASQVRLAAGAAVHLARLDAGGVTIAQLAGRAWVRVGAADRRPLQVVTGPVTWTADGTAFDVDREPVTGGVGSGQERVTVLALEATVTASGAGFDTPVAQGERAIVFIGAATPLVAPAVGPLPVGDLADAWVQANGRLDAAAGLPLGALAGHLEVTATTAPDASAVATPTSGPTATVTAPTSPTPSPGPTPTPRPTAPPTPTPTPQPTVAALGLTATACPGGVVLAWGEASTHGFARYITLRSPAGDPAPSAAYPPTEAYVAQVAGTKTRGATSAVDPAGQSSAFAYRTLVLGSDGQLLAASAARLPGSAGPAGSLDLGVTADGAHPRALDFAWTPFAGPGACFTQYEVRYAATAAAAAQGALLLTSRTAGASEATDVTAPAGTYDFVLLVRRVTALGSLVVAQSAPLPYTVPGP